MIQTYFEISCLFVVGYALVWLVSLVFERNSLPFSTLLKIQKWIIISVLVIPPFLSGTNQSVGKFIRPKAQIWSGARTAFDQKLPSAPIITIGPDPNRAEILSVSVIYGFFACLALMILYRFAAFLNQLRFLRKILRRTWLIKKIGGVQICASDDAFTPFSTWAMGAYVVLPSRFLKDKEISRVACVHELQHHRQGDTLFIYILEVLKILFFWNPFIYFFESELNKVQEFACDEAVVGRRRLDAHNYGSCLLEAVKLATDSPLLVGTTSMATQRPLLERRISMIFQRRSQTSWFFLGTVFIFSLIVIGGSALAFHGTVRDQRVTMEQANKWARTAAVKSEIPIEMNDLVLEELNRLYGTPEGQRHLEEAKLRMPQYRRMIETKLGAQRMPLEILAVPFAESGFENATWNPSAGIWCFIKETARKYGLVVNNQIDERLDDIKSTDAALRYLSDLFFEFQDWRLAIKAYNIGESRLRELIHQLGTRDPWVIERAFPGHDRYLSVVMAHIIILENGD